MKKTIHSRQHKVFLKLLRDTRIEAGLSQVEFAQKLETTQSFISKCERGERRLDILEVRFFCKALRVSFPDFCKRLNDLLD